MPLRPLQVIQVPSLGTSEDWANADTGRKAMAMAAMAAKRKLITIPE